MFHVTVYLYSDLEVDEGLNLVCTKQCSFPDNSPFYVKYLTLCGGRKFSHLISNMSERMV